MWSITITSPATHSEKGEDATRYICLGGYLRSLSWGDSWALWTPMKWSSSRHGHAGWLYLWPTSWSHGWLSPSSLQDSPPPLVGKSSRQLELLLPLGSPSSCGPRWPRGQAPQLPARWNLSWGQRWPSHPSTSLAHLCLQTGSAGRQDACRGQVAGTELLSSDSDQQTGQAWWARIEELSSLRSWKGDEPCSVLDGVSEGFHQLLQLELISPPTVETISEGIMFMFMRIMHCVLSLRVFILLHIYLIWFTW